MFFPHFLKSIIAPFIIGTTQSVFSSVDSLVIELQTFAFSFQGITRARPVLPFPSSRSLFVTLNFWFAFDIWEVVLLGWDHLAKLKNITFLFFTNWFVFMTWSARSSPAIFATFARVYWPAALILETTRPPLGDSCCSQKLQKQPTVIPTRTFYSSQRLTSMTVKIKPEHWFPL